LKDWYDIRDYGAIGNGIANDTKAIQMAINECNKNRGGTVYISGGTFIAGSLYMKSNVYLNISPSAVLLASGNINDYEEDTHYNRYRNEHDMDRCWIYAEDITNFGITGNGEINGNAEAFPNDGSIYRPMMMRFLRCSHIHLESIKLYNSAAWTTAFLDSEFIWVTGVDIRNEKKYNGDGLDFDGCRHVYISDCYIKGTDDNLCLQAGNKEYPMQDVHISNCEFTSICAAVRIGLKSVGDITDIVIQNCTMKNVWREGIKIECTEGGNISDITINNVIMKNVTRPIFVILNNRFEPDGLGSSIELVKMPEIGKLQRIYISNIIAVDDEEMKHIHVRFNNDVMGRPEFNGIRFDAEENHLIEDVVISNLSYTFVGGVKAIDIPTEYPKVLDRIKSSEGVTSENYYPDWSRATYLDMRNIKNLSLNGVYLKSIYKDERKPVILENCSVVEQKIIELS